MAPVPSKPAAPAAAAAAAAVPEPPDPHYDYLKLEGGDIKVTCKICGKSWLIPAGKEDLPATRKFLRIHTGTHATS